MFGFNSAHPGPFPGSPELDAATDGWRDHYHKGWAQRWLTHRLGQVECDHRWPDCEVSDCPTCQRCIRCGAAI